jgi:membrane-associated phospholipid phosphatase
MALLEVVVDVVAVVAALHLVVFGVVAGRKRLAAAPRSIRSNLTAVAPTLGALFGVLALNGVVRDVGVDLSWLVGLNVTGYIYALEGNVVAQIQSVATPELTAYFGFMYVFGYVFLLTFPAVIYALHGSSRPLHVLLLAYSVNYGAGLVCYVLFVAYGPRNFVPELVEPLLFTSWPQAQLLTSEVNRNTNVFPSLHTSLSVTVALVAYRFRATYPRWLPVAAVFAASITVSTMYLGIHWATDVAGGVALAAVSVEVATQVDDGPYLESVRRFIVDSVGG